ncbi:MAG TPA: type II secretion system F family protein [Acidimicrobiia bacterium]|nr:type II secretion system F family protein [Acidimicrobiia bacterium]
MLSLVVALAGPVGVAALVSAAQRANAAERACHLGAGGRWRLPARVRALVARSLAEADITLEPEQAVELWVAGSAGAGLLAATLAPGLVPPALLVALASGPVGVRLARGRRRRRLAAALPGAVEQIAAELRGGGTVGDGIRHLAAGDGPLAPELRRVARRADLGLGLGDALAAWPDESGVPDVRAVAGALAVAATVGGRSAAALDGLAASLRDRLGATAEARSLSAQARLSAVVVGAAPLVYLLFSVLVDPATLAVLLGTGVGRVCLLVGLGLEALAALWMRRIVGATT